MSRESYLVCDVCGFRAKIPYEKRKYWYTLKSFDKGEMEICSKRCLRDFTANLVPEEENDK